MQINLFQESEVLATVGVAKHSRLGVYKLSVPHLEYIVRIITNKHLKFTYFTSIFVAAYDPALLQSRAMMAI